jgi:muconate cycloisomerase
MRIDVVGLHLLRIPFKGAFGHALKQRTEADSVLVVVRTSAGVTGLGEIVPRPYLTGETIEDVFARAAPARAQRTLGLTLSSRDEVVAWARAELEAAGRELATLGGIELAVLDAAAQEMGFPLASLLGGTPGPELPPGVVIGFEVKTAELRKHCALLRFAGRRHIKVKVGQSEGEDLERLQIIAKAMGETHPLRLDANAAWSPDEAVRRLNDLKGRFSIASIEQPVASDDFAGLRRVRTETGVPVMADESLCTLEDGRRLIEAEAADIFNIRVGKCGGLLGSLRLVELARSAGLGLHLGALVGETAVLSRAGERFGAAVSGFDCLEGKGQNKFLLQGDVAADAPGAGGLDLALRESWVAQYEQRRQMFTRTS